MMIVQRKVWEGVTSELGVCWLGLLFWLCYSPYVELKHRTEDWRGGWLRVTKRGGGGREREGEREGRGVKMVGEDMDILG